MNVLYPAKISKEADGRYFVKFLDFSEAFTEGETFDEALYNASEVLTLTLEGRMEERVKIPSPSKKTQGSYLISPSVRVQSAILLQLARKGHSKASLARALGTSWPAIQRLENPKHWTTLKQLEKVAAALGKQVRIDLVATHHPQGGKSGAHAAATRN